MTPFDALLLRRTLFTALLLLGVVSAIVVATDEATSTAGMRVARLAALEPLPAAVAMALVLRQSRERGELRALQCVGVPEWLAARGAVFGGIAFAALGAVALLSPWADARSLFPSVRGTVDWVIDAGGRFASAPSVFVTDGGVIALSVAKDAAPRAVPTALTALPAVMPLALAVPPWIATPMPGMLRGFALALAAGTVVVVLHLVAAGRVSPPFGALAALPVLLSTIAMRARLSGARR
ncbi:MAG TPA: hypothetical protein VHE30_09190 [Polyangiaceae bacterium]|nr:hypothetical protein [Polyangiaceae bacterium]